MEASPRIAGRSQRDNAIAAAATLLLLIGMPVGYLSGNTSTGDVIGMVVLTLVSLALMAGFFLRLIPRERAALDAERAARTALILGVVAVVALVVFWTGLPFPLGAAAAALGLSARDRGPAEAGRGKATAAVVLGALAVLLAFAGLLTG
jgi:hypothetical protein